MTTRLTKREFILKARAVHGRDYGYSEVIYKNNCTKVVITCKIHGNFKQIANNHLRGKGCLKCKGSKISQRKIKWTKGDLITCLARYKDPKEFRTKEPKAYDTIIRRFPYLIDKYFPNRIKPYTKQDILKILKNPKVKLRYDFKTLYPSQYRVAYTVYKPLLDKYLPISITYYNLTKVIKISKKYKYRSDFKLDYPSAYSWARKKGHLDFICKHMRPKANLYRRVIYRYVFPKKRVYVGLTANPISRDRYHRSKYGKLRYLIKRHKTIMEILERDLLPEEALDREEFYINLYRKKSFNVLNSTRRIRSLGYGRLGNLNISESNPKVKQ